MSTFSFHFICCLPFCCCCYLYFVSNLRVYSSTLDQAFINYTGNKNQVYFTQTACKIWVFVSCLLVFCCCCWNVSFLVAILIQIQCAKLYDFQNPFQFSLKFIKFVYEETNEYSIKSNSKTKTWKLVVKMKEFVNRKSEPNFTTDFDCVNCPKEMNALNIYDEDKCFLISLMLF